MMNSQGRQKCINVIIGNLIKNKIFKTQIIRTQNIIEL